MKTFTEDGLFTRSITAHKTNKGDVMFKKLILIGLLGLGLIATASPEANAQISGWGWFGFSGVTGSIDTIHTPNPTSKPSAIRVTIDALIQIACVNPATNGVFNGKAFRNTLANSQVLNVKNITDTKGNAAKTEVFLDLHPFELDSSKCTNPNWTPIPDSAETLNFIGSVFWCLTDSTGQPNCTGKGLLDSSTVTCSLDTTLYPRQTDGKAPHPAILDCSQPQ